MPKPRGAWNFHYNENPTKRVSFKPNRGHPGNRGRGRNWEVGLRHHLEEEDVDMAGFSNGGGSRYNNFRKGRKNRGRVPGNGGDYRGHEMRLLESPLNFYQVTIPKGGRYDKQFILQTLLQNISPLPLIPLLWTVKDQNAFFYVDDYKTASKLYSLNRKLSYPDERKIFIRVCGGTPNVDLSAPVLEKMKVVMAKRYNSGTKALDMTKFHMDPDLQDMFCALCKPAVSLAAIKIISENIPELEALSWNDNKIHVLTHLKGIGKQLPNLKILHIGSNKLRDITQLDNISSLKLHELYLDGNPLCNRYKDQASYLSEVRKRFPKLIKLDGVDLPPPISFDIENKTLPKTKQTFLCSQDGQSIVRQFLEQYIQIMDSDNRQALLHAYHENAMFSLTCGYGYGQNPKNSGSINWCYADNRNLQRVTDVERRRKLLKRGQVEIVAYLKDMPNMKHDIHGFTVDLSLFTPQMMVMTVTGIFKEYSVRTKAMHRHFMRTFAIVPAGSGFCIINEMMYVTNATKEEVNESFRIPIEQTASTSSATATPVTSPVAAAAAAAVADGPTKQQMVQALSSASGMNDEWSQKCLEETQWDYARAQLVFAEAKSKGVIPPEAFTK